MAIRPHPTKPPGWWQIIISRGRGNKQQVYLFEGTKAEAIAFEGDLRGVPREQNNQKPTDVLGRFLDWYAAHRSKNSLIYAESALPKIIERLGNKMLITYRQADYTRYKTIRAADGIKKRTVNLELLIWSSLMRFAHEHLGIAIGDRPQLYTRAQTRPPDKQPLTADETWRLLEQLQGDKKTIAMLYAFCGLRRDEALNLTRGQVELDRGMLHIKGKGDKDRLVPVVGDSLRHALIVACEGKQRADFLFISEKTGKPYKNIKKALIGAAKRAGIDKPVYNHLLRHSAATNAVIAGVNIRALQTILGHSDIRTTELYTHMAAEIIQTEALKMSGMHNRPATTKASEMSETEKTDKQHNLRHLRLIK